MKKALITGITGQDGSYLAEFLMEKGYEVHGLVRRSSSFNRGRIEHLRMNPEIPFGKIHLHYGDMTDTPSLNRLMSATSGRRLKTNANTVSARSTTWTSLIFKIVMKKNSENKTNPTAQ